MHQQFRGTKVDKATYLKVHRNPLKKVNFCKFNLEISWNYSTIKREIFFDCLSYQHNHLPFFLLFHLYSVKLFHHFLSTFFIHTSFLFESTLLSCNVPQRNIKLSKYLGKVQIQSQILSISRYLITISFKTQYLSLWYNFWFF